uniref:CUE domain-containing protein n=1 Tax=Oryza glumipatula TaxID=40148 RepID=A0A0E0B8V8_9ORYZ
MGDHKAVFISLQELFPQVDPRILKAVAIEHHNDVDSAVVAILDEVMPSVTSTSPPTVSSVRQEIAPCCIGTSSASDGTSETGDSSSAGHGKQVEVDENVHSTQCKSSMEITNDRQRNVVDEVESHSSYPWMNEQLHLPIRNVPEPVDISYVGHDGHLLSEYLDAILNGESGNSSTQPNVAYVHKQDSDNPIPADGCVTKDNSITLPLDYVDINDVNYSLKSSAGVSNSEDSFGTCGTYQFAHVLNIPIPDTRKSSKGLGGEQDTNSIGKADLLPDLNLNHLATIASTHSVSIESLDDSISDAKSNKNELLPSLELVSKMIQDVEVLEEKAEVAKHESSIAETSILTKVGKLKEMLNHAKEANDMHACEVFGEKSILTTEARELQSRLQRLSDERKNYLVVIEEIRQTLEHRLVAAQQEIDAAEEKKIQKEASAQALLDEQEKEMNLAVEESRKLQKEAEENLKLKAFLVERGQIVDTLQGEMTVICEDVSQLKQIVDERLSFCKLQRSKMSSLFSSLQSSLHKSGSSADRAIEAVESTDKHTVAEGANAAVGDDPNGSKRIIHVWNGSGMADKDNGTGGDTNEDGWEFC